jgi:hypothetical protein
MTDINKTTLEVEMQAKIDALTSSDTSDDILLLSTEVGNVTIDSYENTVATSADLPTDSVAGTVYFVTNIQIPAVSNGDGTWQTFDGRVLIDVEYLRWAWGANTNGALGDGTTTSRSSPVTSSGGGITWMKVGQGSAGGLGIKTDGTLWSWGLNNYGQVGDNSTTSRLSPVTTAGGGTNWSMIGGAGLLKVALKTDGSLWNWGWNYNGELGQSTSGVGTHKSSPVTPFGGGGWSKCAGGYRHTGGIKNDGTLWLWGDNANGKLGNGVNTTDRSSPEQIVGGGTTWVNLSLAKEYSAATKTDGTLWLWGDNANGKLGNGVNTTDRSSPETTAGGGTTWDKISCGEEHVLAIKTDGTLWAWGNDGSGRLGQGTVNTRSSPVTTAGGGTNWDICSAGTDHSAATKTDGTLWTWGDAGTGELGTGNTTDRSSPGTTVSDVTTWADVSAGHHNTAAVDNNFIYNG